MNTNIATTVASPCRVRVQVWYGRTAPPEIQTVFDQMKSARAKRYRKRKRKECSDESNGC